MNLKEVCGPTSSSDSLEKVLLSSRVSTTVTRDISANKKIQNDVKVTMSQGNQLESDGHGNETTVAEVAEVAEVASSGGSGKDTSIVTPFLVKHIADQNLIPKDNFHKYCYRHNPDVQCNKSTDELKMTQIQQNLEKLSRNDQEAISHCWSIFGAAPSQHRTLILQGLLSQCCFPQLSLISQEVSKLIKIDFISNLPYELSIKILCYLDCSSLCNAAQVNQRWKSLADDDRVWHYMCEQHIDRKCPNCGWGLPLMHMKRAKEYNAAAMSQCNSKKRKLEDGDTAEDASSSKSDNQQNQPQQIVRKKRPWKAVYSERFKVERNWRKGIYTVKCFNGHEDGITCLQFNNDVLITGSYDTTVKIWNIKTGELLRTLSGHSKGVRTLAFDDQKLITGGLDSTIKVWNYHTGQCISTYRGHEDSVVSVDFYNTTIASGSADKTVKVWHVDSRTCYTLRGHTDWVNSVKIHHKSNTIFSASDDTTVRMWDLKSNECLRIFGGVENNGHIGQVQCVIPLTIKTEVVEDTTDESESEEIREHGVNNNNNMNNNNSNMAANNINTDREQTRQQRRDRNRISIAQNTQGAQPVVLRGLNEANSLGEAPANPENHHEAQPSLPPNPNYPTHILTSSLDNTIKLWDVKTGKCIRTQFGHIQGVWSIAADTFRIVSGAHDRLVKVWDLQNGKCIHTFGGNTDSVCCVAIGDSKFAYGSENGEVKMYCFDDDD
ncbi:hypothetical protein PACTADRAFT_74634 [Pachysolen tannophilus NRRL Y-2460]|uniref:F-box domain-containing protein n=1 Tax=Pachysolen tannophilus NRRL Y-2460 TaxID=669874 RepID=A0A1E4TZ89_PACTA|nr:hypothetical protein PACTADRAFT_74634 [Pachysolen tannophilus NRRL Y-2460]